MIPAVPPVVNLQVVRTCNLRCTFCSHDRWEAETGMMGYDLFEQVMDRLTLDGVSTVCFVSAQGESLLHPRIMDMLARSLGFGFETNLVTNGTPLNEKRIAELRALSLDAVQFSFAGWDVESYESRYVGGKFRLVVRNLAGMIAALKGTRTTLTINGVCDNQIDAERTRAFLRTIGAAEYQIAVNLPHNWGGTVRTGVEQAGVWSNRNLSAMTRGLCPLLVSTPGVYIDGRVTACGCIDANGAMEIGRIQDERISVMRGGKRYRAMVEAFERGDVSGLPLCSGCEIPFRSAA